MATTQSSSPPPSQRSTFTLEHKTFEIDRALDVVSIKEFGTGLPRSVSIPTSMADQISQRMLDSIAQPPQSPRWGRFRANDLSASLLQKQTHRGKFLSILFVAPHLRRGGVEFCVPMAVDASGWSLFASILGGNDENRSTPAPPVVVENKIHYTPHYGVLATVIKGDLSWEKIVEYVTGTFILSAPPTVCVLGQKTFVLDFGDEDDANRLVRAPKLVLPEGVISLKRGTHPWLVKKDRWAELAGVPLHLCNIGVLKNLCSGFGEVTDIDIMGARRGFSVVRVLIRGCDLEGMPHGLSLVDPDLDIVFPVKATLIDDVIPLWEENLTTIQ